MKNILRYILFCSFLGICLSSCVLQKQHDSLLAEKIRLEAALSDSADSLEVALLALDSLQKVHKDASSKSNTLTDNLSATKSELDALKDKYSELTSYYNNLKNSSGQLNKNLVEQQQELLEIRENLDKTRLINDRLNHDLMAREKKVTELENVLAKKAAASKALKEKINKALLSFNKNDLEVKNKNGKIYVSMAEKLLFSSGSTTIDEKGEKALQQLASVLSTQKEINIMVEGHTDNVPISKGSNHLKDNWDLSVLRATSIVRILTANGVSPQQIIAAGKGEFAPITDNKSSINRQKNRRTDIIITPDLNKLFSILNIE